MVFHCRCFSFEYEPRSRGKSSSTETFYTASSDFKRSKSDHHTSSNFALKGNNLRVFTFGELKSATSDFSMSSKIGEGEFWSVHKGTVKSLECPFDEIQVAVKLANGRLPGHIKRLREASLLGVIDHPNLVKLVGYCVEDDETEINPPILVYEYMRNGSVEDCLSSATSTTHLSWTMRLKIAQDVARGLAHLHEGAEYQVIFRDFKSSNILLDDRWNAKLSFRWLSLHPHPLNYISTSSVTTGYSAPEYNQTFIETGHLTAACNVWSYGCFLYELITGRLPLDRNHSKNDLRIVKRVKSYLQSKRVTVDPRLEDDYSIKSAQKLWIIANRCLSKNPKSRPKMSHVLKMVDKLIGVPSQGV
ncbi:serine/threonine-protein kinase PCRK2 [Lactuca sativa]|uniref:Protein kinase domain-containing protein n=1 Tax=Lactuca sativa TaxID=4236 RepID=A0A9R1XXJ3_LACSA|nr:serine/threonine-protein kinase PCRK2 [Lactuca sativa]KAJ0224762.1 hypothetical protein LSAT_V11C100021640 [Lactuca sativa]